MHYSGRMVYHHKLHSQVLPHESLKIPLMCEDGTDMALPLRGGGDTQVYNVYTCMSRGFKYIP